jgi:sialate O-acetylesterase
MDVKKTIAAFAVTLSFMPSAWAQLQVAPIFGSNMVLQRGTQVPVFGTSDPGATVTVDFQGQSVSAVADAAGNWQVNLASMPASTSPSAMTVASGAEQISMADVQVGETWLCSGQSNMAWELQDSDNGAQAIADAGSHNIRLFFMDAGNGPETTSWAVSSSQTTPGFSAVCYWMGLELAQWFQDVPIGLIQATHDGTSIQSWHYSSGGTAEDYEAMVKPIQPYAVQGVAWYQGESDGGDSDYVNKLRNMVNEWRADWGQSSLPFGIVQLADRKGWNEARNGQLVVADTMEEAFLVVIKDIKGGQLHPTTKKPVGIRTGIGARGLVYGDAITWSGPIRDTVNSYVSGNTVVLKWKHLGGGLTTDDGSAPGPFKVAGSSGRFVSADAVIVGDEIHVSSSRVSAPTRVQYAYSDTGNLFNHVLIYMEGGSVVVDKLKASEFEIDVAPLQ